MRLLAVKISFFILFLVITFFPKNILAIKYSSCDINKDDWYKIIDFDKDVSVEIFYNECKLNLKYYRYLAVPINNKSSEKLFVDAIWGNGKKWLDFNARYIVEPNSIDTVKYLIHRNKKELDKDWLNHFPSARGFPNGVHSHWKTINLNELNYIKLKVSANKNIDNDSVFFKAPFGKSNYEPIQFKDQSIPIIDELGQYSSANWEGKTENIDQLKKQGEIDQQLYKSAKFSTDHSIYGGFKKVGKFNASGFFRTQKIDDKWWFIDPDGYPFWSIGVTGAGKGNQTKTLNKEFLFSDISNEINILSISNSNKISNKRGINYYNLNLIRKYGKNWEEVHHDVTIGRYKNWGINTFGAWSIVQNKSDIPFTLVASTKKQNIGKIENTIDPFNPQFIIDLKNNLNNFKNLNNDPWLIGVFVHNEIHWGKNLDIPIELLKLSNSPARSALEIFFQNKYSSIKEMNQVWSSNYENFKDINDQIDIKNQKVRSDLKDFFEFYVDYYFKTVDREFRKVFPNHLYLGCRLYEKTHGNKIVRKIAAKYCDVLSYNVYKYSLTDFDFFKNLNKPVIIGEFHFGTGTHGVWGTGLRVAYNLEQQAELYKQFVYEASINPAIIGAHWFQWTDQPATGRFDGENFRIGFVSITDQPYEKLVDATKHINSNLLEWRK
ncbi:MAG: hypothetical protein CBC95_003705 [Crocinitomicaceae bacterium TMED135]|nr:MAG: hypothetical protein CBC95_003705 [Crocinitomicaceae bacterium TMED135]